MEALLKKNYSALRYWRKRKSKIKDTSAESFAGRNPSQLDIEL